MRGTTYETNNSFVRATKLLTERYNSTREYKLQHSKLYVS